MIIVISTDPGHFHAFSNRKSNKLGVGIPLECLGIGSCGLSVKEIVRNHHCSRGNLDSTY